MSIKIKDEDIIKVIEDKNNSFNNNTNNNKEKDTTTNKKKKKGRPYKQIDLDKVYSYASVCCTQEEICNILNFDRNLFNTREDLIGIYKKGISNAKLSLRRKQFILADTNPTMAIWLGKQLLGQRDKHEVEQTNIQRVEIVNDLDSKD